LYERYGSLDNAEEAFTSVLKKDPNFEKSNEIYFRLGIVYKQQCKYDNSLEVCIWKTLLTLECFGYILDNPPSPLSQGDIWFQIGHVYELKKDVRISFYTKRIVCRSKAILWESIATIGMVVSPKYTFQ
jgi:glucose repression mediator protein